MQIWRIDGRWRHNRTGKQYRASFRVASDSAQDPVQVLHDNFDFNGMTYLGGSVTRDPSDTVVMIEPFKEEK